MTIVTSFCPDGIAAAEHRQAALERLFLQPARSRPALRFLIGGSQYPQSFPWGENVWYTRHVPPQDHSAFYGSAGSR